MKNIKKQPRKQLEKYSNIFTQLGLVLVLFVVYVVLEHQTEQVSVAVLGEKISTVSLNSSKAVYFKKEIKPVPKIKKLIPEKKASKLIDDNFKKGENTIEELPFEEDNELENQEIIDINALNTENEPEKITEDVDFIFIQNAPIFKGCEGLSKEQNKICFDKKMKKHVQRNFDVQLANEIGLSSGKYKIYTQFVIDDKGEIIDVMISTPFKPLEKEAQRIINKLPKFKPGKQNNKTVRVKYSLPITFGVE